MGSPGMHVPLLARLGFAEDGNLLRLEGQWIASKPSCRKKPTQLGGRFMSSRILM